MDQVFRFQYAFCETYGVRPTDGYTEIPYIIKTPENFSDEIFDGEEHEIEFEFFCFENSWDRFIEFERAYVKEIERYGLVEIWFCLSLELNNGESRKVYFSGFQLRFLLPDAFYSSRLILRITTTGNAFMEDNDWT